MLHLATLGGAQVLGLAEEIGTLAPAKHADISTSHANSCTELGPESGLDQHRE
jgi:cytosine/adenosine deaminase-related metal-dependent hydrolase